LKIELQEQKLEVNPNKVKYDLILQVAYLGLAQSFDSSYLCINCIEVMAPKKNTVGTAKP
jgi:hypothetical protein